MFSFVFTFLEKVEEKKEEEDFGGVGDLFG